MDFPFFLSNLGPRESTILEKLSVFHNRLHTNILQVWNMVLFYSFSQCVGFHTQLSSLFRILKHKSDPKSLTLDRVLWFGDREIH